MSETDSTPLDERIPPTHDEDVPFGDAEQAANARALIGEDPNGPVVQISHRHAQTADAAWLVMMSANDKTFPRVMVRGSHLVRMTPDGLEEYGPHSLRDRMSRTATFQKKDPVEPPIALANTLLNREAADYWRAPFVKSVVEVPVLSASGRLITEPGYHREDQLYYRPIAGLEDIERHIGDHTQVDDVVASRDLLLNDLLGDFGFADGASQANALGLLLLPFVREMIGDAPTPMHAIGSSGPGSGKTLLAEVCLIPACGQIGVTTTSRDPDEMRKKLTAQLMTAPPAIVFDNLSEVLDSGHLAGALTTGVWRDRRIQYSEHLVLKVRNAWVATANGLEMSNEISRRTTLIELDPGDVRPSDRPSSAFRHPDLAEWAMAHRAELVGAALTLVRHWIEGEAHMLPSGDFAREERRTGSTATLGSYNQWAEVIGGILAACDVRGFLVNRDQIATKVDVETESDTAFLAAWRSWRGDEPITTSELSSACAIELRDMLPDALLEVPATRLEHRLRYWLRSHKERPYGDLVLKGARDGAQNGRNPMRWTVTTR